MIREPSVEQLEKTRERQRVYARLRRKNNPEHVKEIRRIWRLKNIDRARAQSRASAKRYRKKDPNRYRAQMTKAQKRHNEKYPEARRDATRRWNEAHPEQRKQITKNYYDKNKEKRDEATAAFHRENPNYKKEWVLANQERMREINLASHLRTAYGLTIDEHAKMHAAQNGRCAICKTTDPGVNTRGNGSRRVFCVDHDHVTGRVRGLLCTRCNQAIGHLHDDPALIYAAIEYLKG